MYLERIIGKKAKYIPKKKTQKPLMAARRLQK